MHHVCSTLFVLALCFVSLSVAHINPPMAVDAHYPALRHTPELVAKYLPKHNLHPSRRNRKAHNRLAQAPLGAEWDGHADVVADVSALTCPPLTAVCPVPDMELPKDRPMSVREWAAKFECVNLVEDARSCGGCSTLDARSVRILDRAF
jgi:hypothetical protein